MSDFDLKPKVEPEPTEAEQVAKIRQYLKSAKEELMDGDTFDHSEYDREVDEAPDAQIREISRAIAEKNAERRRSNQRVIIRPKSGPWKGKSK